MTTRRRATRSLALGLGAALAFALTPAVATANEIVNGDFETGDLAGWNIYGGTAAVIDGAACLDVPAGIGPYGAAFQQRITLQPDTEYSLTFEAAVPSGTPAAVTAVVQLPRDPYTGYLPPQDITSELSPTPTGFEWSFQTPAELPPADVSLPDGPNASVEIQHTAENAEGYRLCLDDVVLEGGTDLVVNGGFDDGLVGWGIAYPEAIVNDAGEGCIVVPAGTGAYGAGLGQLVTLEP
ncbi:MAG: carbohydrate binding domain-containing protein, partial [Actinomycetota bacterium]